MDASWPRTWPEVAELHVFDPEGDVLLILDRCLKEDGLVESVNKEKRESVLDRPEPEQESVPYETPAEIPNWPEPEPESVPYEIPAEIPEAEVDGMTEPENSASAFLACQEAKPKIEKVQMRVSSRHLILASPTFRISLGSDTYSEGRIL
jgi:hypothetical protein